MKRFLVTVAVAALAILMLPDAAAAHHAGGGQSGARPDGSGFFTGWVRSSDFSSVGHGSGCTYTIAANSAWPSTYNLLYNMGGTSGPVPDQVGAFQDSAGRWYWSGNYDGVEVRFAYQECGTSGPTLVWLPTLTGTNLGNWAFDELLRNIPQPDPYFHPLDTGGPWAYTQVPTDYRLETLYNYVARASGNGAWVEATAVPREVVFDLTDVGRVVDSSGTVVSQVTCPALASVAPYDPGNPGACSLTFLDSSSISGDSDFDYEVSVVWDVTFTSFGVVGPFPPPTTITTFTTGESVRVGEARPSS